METLPQLFRQEGHEGVYHGQAALERRVQGVESRPFALAAAMLDDGLRVLDECVA